MGDFNGAHSPPSVVSKGFTLLELIIVVSLIAVLATIVIPRFDNRNNEIKSVVRKFVVLARDLKARAKLYNATYRIAIHMTEDEQGEPLHEYWVERAAGRVLNSYDPKDPPTLPDEDDDDEESPQSSSPFQPDKKVMKKKLKLPDGLIFESIELGLLDDPVTEGLVYIHYLPVGFSDEAAIHLKHGEDLKWTLIIEPLTGQLDILTEFRSLEDLRRKK